MAANIESLGHANIVQSETQIVQITLDNSYPAGGYSIGNVLGLIPVSGTSGYVPSLDPVNGKLMLFRQNATTGALQEVPNATAIGSPVIRAILLRA
jgi:hypothetical protein